MHPLAYFFMAFGAILAVIGIVLFAKKGAQGANVVKMFGFEFQLAGSALVIFVVGILVFLYPFIYRDHFPVPFVNTDISAGSDQIASTPPVKSRSESSPKSKTMQPTPAHWTFRTKLHMLTGEEGGRNTAIFDGYSPSINFDGTSVRCRVELPAHVEMVMPGTTLIVTIHMVDRPVSIQIGSRFEIKERDRIVGTGVIAEVLE